MQDILEFDEVVRGADGFAVEEPLEELRPKQEGEALHHCYQHVQQVDPFPGPIYRALDDVITRATATTTEPKETPPILLLDYLEEKE